MTHAISVPTPFNDIAELGESFASRVDAERLMLPHAEPVPEGEWVQFAVTLADGSAALSGVGRCKQSFDNGEDRDPEYRYEVEMDSLQFDEMAQIYFERLLQVRAAQFGEEPPTGEIEVPPEAQYAEAPYEEPAYEEPAAQAYQEAAPAEAYPAEAYEAAVEPAYDAEPVYEEPVAAEPAYDAQPAYEDAAASAFEPETDDLEAVSAELDELTTSFDDEPYADPGDVGYGEPREDIAPPALQAPAESAIYELPPPVPPGQLPSPHATQALVTRRYAEASWRPEPQLRPDPSPSSGYFDYPPGSDLPVPDAPPRPDLDPTMRVAPAPQPGEEGPISTPAPRAAEPAYEQSYAEDDYAAGDEAYELSESNEVEVEASDYADPYADPDAVADFDEDERRDDPVLVE